MDNEFVFDFERLEVYQYALEFFSMSFGVFRTMPRDVKYSLGNQLLRASLSISNNIAEGSGKLSGKEKKRYYSISLDSCRECVSVLNALKREKLLDEKSCSDMRRKAISITNMLNGLIKSVKDYKGATTK